MALELGCAEKGVEIGRAEISHSLSPGTSTPPSARSKSLRLVLSATRRSFSCSLYTQEGREGGSADAAQVHLRRRLGQNRSPPALQRPPRR